MPYKIIKLTIIICSLFVYIKTNGQKNDKNLVPNHSFEKHIAGKNPYGSSRGRVAEDWYSPTDGTPDFFIKWSYREGDHDNWPGFKLARTGDCFFGLMTRYVFTESNSGNTREYVTAKLKRPLVKNQKYEIIFYTQLAQNSYYATYSPEVYFSKHKPDTVGYNGVLNVTPQITTSQFGMMKNTMRWKKINGFFTAQGGEEYITIGNFHTNHDTFWETMENVGKYNIYYFAYYFIDDIFVVPINYFDNDLVPGQANILKNLMFEKGAAELLSGSIEELTKLINLMREYPQLEIEIVGHSDNVGRETANYKLSYDRARAVAQYLIEEGIDANRITHQGQGSKQPIDDNSTEKGRENNRRVEFIVKKI